jgi:HJR/Mrr/RecB family endonuclease
MNLTLKLFLKFLKYTIIFLTYLLILAVPLWIILDIHYLITAPNLPGKYEIFGVVFFPITIFFGACAFYANKECSKMFGYEPYAVLKTIFYKLKHKPKPLRSVTIYDIDKMDGIEFELVLKTLFENIGYSVELTPPTNDQGADLILKKFGDKISVQAKNWTANVGNDAVQQVVGSLKFYKTKRGMVITSSDFTNQAITLAAHNHVELWNRDKLIEMIAKYPVSK